MRRIRAIEAIIHPAAFTIDLLFCMPVCLVSMTASSAEETPRGMDFLFSLNRINVAVSRAKGLALVFGAPRLREAKCETVEQMRLVNTLCALPVFKQNERGSA